jgi:two-component system response regulator (stage 0 sporulation protein F)
MGNSSLMCDIIVTDDDDEMRALLAASLGSRGYDVEDAVGAVELFAKLTRLSLEAALPAVLICDYRMPGCDGLEVIERIQSEYPSMSVILITAFGDDHVHWRAKALGAVAVFDKPFGLEDLHGAVVDLFDIAGST